MSFRIIRNDITKVSADAIVNTANPDVMIGGGTDTAIYNAAGKKKLLAERKKIGVLKPGDVRETPAFGLDATYILHAVGPVWEDGKHHEEEILRQTYLNALELAKQLKCKSIAFPLMCSGSNGFPDGKALSIALSVLQEYSLEHRIKILLVLFDTSIVELCGSVYNDIEQYVEDHYVDNALMNEYALSTKSLSCESVERNIRRRERNQYKPKQIRSDAVYKNAPDIKELLNKKDEKTFVDKVIEYVRRSGKDPSKIYLPMYYSRAAYSKMICNPNLKPKKDNAMLFCLSLELSYEESIDLLARAGYAFDVTDKREMFVEACIVNGFYSISVIDEMLSDHGLPTLVKYK